MTSRPAYAKSRDCAREAAILDGLAEHHQKLAASAQDDETRDDHARAAQSCRDNAARWRGWESFGEVAARVVTRSADKMRQK